LLLGILGGFSCKSQLPILLKCNGVVVFLGWFSMFFMFFLPIKCYGFVVYRNPSLVATEVLNTTAYLSLLVLYAQVKRNDFIRIYGW